MTYKEIAIELTGSCQKGYTSFEVEAKQVKELARLYPDMFDMEETQNDSPSVGEFLEGALDEDIFIGYVIDESREDKRVSIEGIITKSKKVASLFLESHPDEFEHNTLKGPFRLWWD